MKCWSRFIEKVHSLAEAQHVNAIKLSFEPHTHTAEKNMWVLPHRLVGRHRQIFFLFFSPILHFVSAFLHRILAFLDTYRVTSPNTNPIHLFFSIVIISFSSFDFSVSPLSLRCVLILVTIFVKTKKRVENFHARFCVLTDWLSVCCYIFFVVNVFGWQQKHCDTTCKLCVVWILYVNLNETKKRETNQRWRRLRRMLKAAPMAKQNRCQRTNCPIYKRISISSK